MARDHALNKQHAKSPEAGDVWHEMLTMVCVVVGVDAERVAVIRKKRGVGSGHWTWDMSALEHMTRDAFMDWLHYKSIDAYWADVRPRAHLWVREVLIEESEKRLLAPVASTAP